VSKMAPFEKERTGWSLTSHASQCVLKHLRLSDHPNLRRFGGFAAFYRCRSHPPWQAWQGGECARLLARGVSL